MVRFLSVLSKNGHFFLSVLSENGRLFLSVLSENGTEVAGEAVVRTFSSHSEEGSRLPRPVLASLARSISRERAASSPQRRPLPPHRHISDVARHKVLTTKSSLRLALGRNAKKTPLRSAKTNPEWNVFDVAAVERRNSPHSRLRVNVGLTRCNRRRRLQVRSVL